MIQSVREQAPLLPPGPISDGQFYSPPESPAGTVFTSVNLHIF